MITIKSPIELKTRTDFVHDNMAFEERIAGNYSLMGLEIGPEELLHIVSQPPEIYLAEGGATTIVGNTLIQSRNEEKLDIVNNMLNRIMLSVNTELSYQDRVYITDTLYKLGIRDDRKFMSEVRRMMRQELLDESFINNYLEMRYDTERSELREEVIRQAAEVAGNRVEERERADEYYLSSAIMHRLQTGAIYQIVANNNKSIHENRIDLEEQMISEQENTAREMLVLNFLENTERETGETVYREESAGREGASARESVTERIREREVYTGTNVYERELARESVREREVSGTVNAAVLYDIIKNLYNAGYERIVRNESWTEYRGALYHSSENTLNRVSYEVMAESPAGRITLTEEDDVTMNLDYREFEELTEIEENEGNIELIENQIREMNERNLQNVSRYEQMTQILKKLNPERRSTGGRERTRRESLAALEDEQRIWQSLEEGEGEQEERRREVFSEITRLFPDNAAMVYNVVEQYLSNPASLPGVSMSAGNVAQAAEEIMRLQQVNAQTASREIPEEIPPVEEGLVHRREERLSEEDVTEILDSYRRQDNRQHRDVTESRDETETRTVNTTTVTNTRENRMTQQEIEDIEDMVAKGVRSQMGAISEQVLTRLEKRLRNEKSRRGL